MLDTFRRNTRSAIFQLIIGVITLVFIISFGPASDGCGATGGTGWAAKVNGETVAASAFDTALRNNFQYQQQMRGGNYSTDDAKADNLRAETLDSLVELELAAQAALDSGIWVGDKEVQDEVVRQFTNETGRFDRDLYTRSVQYSLGLSPRKYEERLRRQLLAQRFYELALGSVAVSEDELRAEFARNNERASMNYVRFSPSQFTSEVEVSDAEIDLVLANQKDEVQKRYDETRYKYLQPRGVKVEHIVVRLAQDATAEEEEAAREKIDAAKNALEQNEPFAQVAEQYSDEDAFDLGWIEQGRSSLGRSVEEVALSLSPGSTSNVIRNRQGFHLVRVIDERPPSEKSLGDVEREVAREIAAEEGARKKAKEVADETLKKLKDGENLADLWPAGGEDSPVPGLPFGQGVGGNKPEVKSAESFSIYGGLIPAIGSVPKLSQAVFALSADKRIPDEVVEDQRSFWVFELTGRERPNMDEFDQAKEGLRARLKGQRQGELRQQINEDLRKKAKIKENPAVLSWSQAARGFDPNAF